MAVKPPENALDAVAATVEPARSVRVGLRWEQRERYHLTLQFLGPVRELAPVVDGLSAAVGDRAAFPFRLGGAGAFPKPGRARVVWMGAAVGGPDLVGLAGAVAGGLRPLGYEPDRKEFHPHLTLARLKVPDNVDRCPGGHRAGGGGGGLHRRRGHALPEPTVAHRADLHGAGAVSAPGCLRRTDVRDTVVDRRGIPRLSSVSHPAGTLPLATSPRRHSHVDDGTTQEGSSGA